MRLKQSSGISVRVLVVGFVATFSALCCSEQVHAAGQGVLTGGGPALTAGSRDVTITSFDGTQIAMTVFTPNAPANVPVPLIVHSHGWAEHRMHTLTAKGLLDHVFYAPPEAAVKLAVDNGYFAISYDQRGWGDSNGVDEMMSPQYEGKDLIAVLNWADSNLGPQLARRNGKMVAGTLGYSYGGGFQMMGASLDDRIAVMVPSLAWHYFGYSLGPGEPNAQPKVQWAELLKLGGLFLSNNHAKSANPILLAEGTDAIKHGDAANVADLFTLTGQNGPNAYCGDTQYLPFPGQSVPTIPTFLVQGWQDTLFNANEAIQNAQCLRNAGADVRLLIQQFGHEIPGSVKIPKGDGIVGFAFEQTPHCGNQSFDLPTAMFSFIDENMFGPAHYSKHVDIPENCYTLDTTQGVVLNGLPPAPSAVYSVRSTNVSGTTFVPLYTATGAKTVVGIPHMKISITAASGDSPYAFFGIGVQRAGAKSASILDLQYFPIHGTGDYDVDMNGVATALGKGDVIGIVAEKMVPMFKAKQSKAYRNPPDYAFSGTFSLPYVN
jgi:pimeloyl-ACP methyl ester carboxylesterase